MGLRALSGATREGGGHHTAEGVQIVKGKKAEAGWIRPGLPCGVKAEMKGEMMWTFLSTLSTFVLPRLKDFAGFKLPPPSANPHSPSAVSGVVSIGLPPHAMALFPQIEVNVDSYPKMLGFHIHFITNARGIGAQTQARQLLSGFQIPFARR
jgi:large subunit ribosomal protein L5